MKITVKYFASIRETLGKREEMIHTQARTLAALRDELSSKGQAYASALDRRRAVRVALAQVMSNEDARLYEGAEVAFFPPVTGG